MKELEEISKLQVQNRINIYCFNMGVNQANVTHVGPLLWRGERAGLTEGSFSARAHIHGQGARLCNFFGVAWPSRAVAATATRVAGCGSRRCARHGPWQPPPRGLREPPMCADVRGNHRHAPWQQPLCTSHLAIARLID